MLPDSNPDTCICCTPRVFTFSATEYDSVERWGVEPWTVAEMERLFVEMERDGVELILPITGAGDKGWSPMEYRVCFGIP